MVVQLCGEGLVLVWGGSSFDWFHGGTVDTGVLVWELHTWVDGNGIRWWG